MNVIDNDKLSATIAAALADAQARGLALEDHEAALLHDLLHGTLTEASTDLNAALKPVLDALTPTVSVLADLNTTLELFSRESAAWRALVARIFNLPPEQPK